MTRSVRTGPEILRPEPGNFKEPYEENLHVRIYEGSAERTAVSAWNKVFFGKLIQKAEPASDENFRLSDKKSSNQVCSAHRFLRR